MISKAKWRIVTQQRENDILIELTAPGYSTRIDKGVTEREAVPKPIKGPFILDNNGYGIQIISGDNKLVGFIRFGKELDMEEALWVAQKCLEGLNKV